MADWQEDKADRWPVKYPVEAPPPTCQRRFQARTPPRWTGSGNLDTRELQKRLLWFLLAIEIGMAVAAACLLPLVFVKLPEQEEGVIRAALSQVGEWLGLSSHATCLVLALPVPILLSALGLNLRWFRRIQRKAEGATTHQVDE